jgi:hypothetical protein
MTRIKVSHFQNLFRTDNHATIAEGVRMAQIFSRFVEENDNLSLMEEISEEELK